MPHQSVNPSKAPCKRGRPPKLPPAPEVNECARMVFEISENGVLVLELKNVRSQFVVTGPTPEEIKARKFRRSDRVVRTPGGGAALLNEFVFSMHLLGYVVIQ